MGLSIEQVRHVAKLARLRMGEEEMRRLLPHLAEMVEVFDRLHQVDTEGLEPTSHSVPVSNVWREDRIAGTESGPRILGASASSRGGLFIVPGILEEE
jgi:aspartyl-tRNA(Asn)/glutamyl-tRNA(Gln) amidotransferase subunit C